MSQKFVLATNDDWFLQVIMTYDYDIVVISMTNYLFIGINKNMYVFNCFVDLVVVKRDCCGVYSRSVVD